MNWQTEGRMADGKGLLLDAAEWRLISLLLECPVGRWKEHVAALAAEVADSDLKTAAEAAQREASEGTYHSILGPGGPAPSREVSYCSLVQPGQLLAELRAYYDAFSFTAATGEAPDHVSIEAGFVAYLRLKQAYALECSDSEHAALSEEAARQFIDDHMCAIAEPLARRLEESGVDYLTLAAAGLLRRTGPPRSRRLGQGLPVLPNVDEAGFECGGA
jgi:nitrate reductase assembly molybdenum cofactor insertion protein NarJ